MDRLRDYLGISTYYPPAYHSLVAVAFFIIGPGVTVARFVNLVLLLVLILLTFDLGQRYASRREGLLAAFLISTYPICVGYSRVIYLDFPLLVVIALNLWLLDRKSVV